jgi:hypothetical protein
MDYEKGGYMSFKPNNRQALYLWKLLAFDEGVFFGQWQPPLQKAAERNDLEKNGLIDIPPEKFRTPKGGMARKVYLSDKGWAWAAENMGVEFCKTQESSLVLEKLLKKLKRFVDANENVALANLFCPDAPETPGISDRHNGKQDLKSDEKSIREAYLQVSGGKFNVRVRLCDLRKALPSMPRERFDEVMLAMQKDGKLVMYNLDDPSEIGPEDEQAAIDIFGQKRHIVYMED